MAANLPGSGAVTAQEKQQKTSKQKAAAAQKPTRRSARLVEKSKPKGG
jgi:hypothetical protein